MALLRQLVGATLGIWMNAGLVATTRTLNTVGVAQIVRYRRVLLPSGTPLVATRITILAAGRLKSLSLTALVSNQQSR